jgi:tetratricopeptide (TPR) repeat protein
MKKVIIFLLVLMSFRASGQNYKKDFEKLCVTGDTIKQENLLKKWEKAKPNDAELYIAWFNFYVSKAKTEIVTTIPHPDDAKATATVSKTKAKGKKVKPAPAAYTSEIGYRQEPLSKGFKYINAGIDKYPTRLDMRFGKIYMLGETYMFTALTKDLVSTIAYSGTIHNKWKWTDNKPLEKPEQFMLSAVQEYVALIYNSGGKAQVDNMKQIAEAVLKLYPKHVESLSDLGISYSVKGDLDNALKNFLKATAIAPKDFIVLNNIANIYEKKSDTTNAIKYYQLTQKYGDPEAKDMAGKELKKLEPPKKAVMPKQPAKKATTTAAKKKSTK